MQEPRNGTRHWWLLVGAAAFLLLIVGPQLGNPFRDSANEKVISKVQRDNRNEPWMKHVTDWSSRPRGITVTTDYPPDRKASWLAAHEICSAVKQAYAKGATELPRVVVNGTDTRVSIRVDGSKHLDPRSVQLATSSKSHDYVCGITPPGDDRDSARKLDIPVYSF